MSVQPNQSPEVFANDDSTVRALYNELINGWNKRNGVAMAAPFAIDGEIIGFDGSQHIGQAEIAHTVQQIFDQHPTPPYLTKIKKVRFLTSETAILSAIVGMIPPSQTEIASELNALQTLVAVKRDGQWRVAFLQNTPAQFHGRPELVQQLTNELQQLT